VLEVRSAGGGYFQENLAMKILDTPKSRSDPRPEKLDPLNLEIKTENIKLFEPL